MYWGTGICSSDIVHDGLYDQNVTRTHEVKLATTAANWSAISIKDFCLCFVFFYHWGNQVASLS